MIAVIRKINPFSTRTILVLVFVGALVLRLALIFLFATYRIDPSHNHWLFGAEVGRVALSLATGSGFASPVVEGTGPTAWFTPVFPLILAAVFKIFGIYSVQSAVAIYTINSLFSALTCVLLYWVAGPVFGRAVGIASAIFFALYPTAIWHSINTIWNTSLLALAMVVLMGLLVRAMSDTSYKLTLATGLMMGVVLLIDPAPAFFYPFALGLYFWMHKGRLYVVRNLATLALLPVLLFGPWMLRNYLVLGAFTPRCCSGLELRRGNNETSWQQQTSLAGPLHPTVSEAEFALYLQLGEIAYDRYCMAQAKQFIQENPGKFMELTGWRFLGWWAGETKEGQGSLHTELPLQELKRIQPLLPIPFFLIGAVSVWQKRSAWIILLLTLIYPIPYYFVHVTQRYRFPIEPFLVLLATQGLFVALRWLDSLRSQVPFRRRQESPAETNVFEMKPQV